MSTLVVGVGSEFRGDDAAGLLAVRELATLRPSATLEECTGDLTSLIDWWDGYDRVVLIDAMRSGRRAGTVRRLEGTSELLPPTSELVGTHALSVGDTLALAQRLSRAPTRVVLWGIEGAVYETGAAPSPEIVTAAAETALRVAVELRLSGG